VGRWTREELEGAFADYQSTALRAGATGDWNAWAERFTEDATYVEHAFGTFGGREAIRRWITTTMSTFPGNAMPHFPIDWYVIDEERGWVLCSVWNEMDDPGDGSLHREYNWTMLHYAGNGQFSYEEDMYNPNEFGVMIGRWRKAKKAAAGS
jgi:hypothetical protein